MRGQLPILWLIQAVYTCGSAQAQRLDRLFRFFQLRFFRIPPNRMEGILKYIKSSQFRNLIRQVPAFACLAPPLLGSTLAVLKPSAAPLGTGLVRLKRWWSRYVLERRRLFMSSNLKLKRGLAVAFLGLGLLAAPMSATAETYVEPNGAVVHAHPRSAHRHWKEENRDACANAARLENQYRHDRATGHPAAANDVLAEMRTAESRCNER